MNVLVCFVCWDIYSPSWTEPLRFPFISLQVLARFILYDVVTMILLGFGYPARFMTGVLVIFYCDRWCILKLWAWMFYLPQPLHVFCTAFYSYDTPCVWWNDQSPTEKMMASWWDCTTACANFHFVDKIDTFCQKLKVIEATSILLFWRTFKSHFMTWMLRII